MTVCKPKDMQNPVFVVPAEFIAKQLDKIVNLDDITADRIIEKAHWTDRLKAFSQQMMQ